MTARVLVRRATALLTLAFVAACGSSDSTAPKGSFKLTAPATSVATAAGTGGQATLTLSRTGGFSGAVTLSIDNASPGVTANINPSVATSNVTTVAVDYSVDRAVAAGAAPTITVRAKSPGQADQVATITLAVSAAPSFLLNTPKTLAIAQEGVTTLALPLSRFGGFTGVIDVVASNLPTGVTALFSTVAKDTAYVTVTAAPTTATGSSTTAAAGTYQIYLTSTNGAIGRTQVDTVALTVAAAPSFNTVVTPTAVRLTSPNSVQYSVTIDRRNGFAAPITVTAVGLPAGLTSDVVTTSGNTAVITVTGSNAAIASTTTIQIRASAAGLANRNANVSLLVTGLLQNGVTVSGLSGALNTARYYRVTVPAGATSLTISTATSGATAANTDIDIAIRAGALPDIIGRTFDCVAETSSSAESCTISNPAAGDYFVVIFGFTAYAGISITAAVKP